MITAIEIEDLRGLHEMRLEGLTPVTVLTGVNGCGKSTVLDGLLLGATTDPAAALGRVVERRPALRDAARWVVRRGARPAEARIAVRCGEAWSRKVVVEYEERGLETHPTLIEPPFRRLSWAVQLEGKTRSPFSWVTVDQGGRSTGRNQALAPELVASAHVSLVDPSQPEPLDRQWRQVFELGRKAAVLEALGSMVPGALSLQSLIEDDGTSSLYVERADGAVPLATSGDGVQAAVQIAIHLAVAGDGATVLLEEPEVFQHPASLALTADVVLAAARSGVQVVLSTHSLELLDMLLDSAGRAGTLDALSVFLLSNAEGRPRSGRWEGSHAQELRAVLSEDLR